MTLLSDGNYMFTIFVTALAVGAESKLEADTLVVPNSPIPNYVTSYALSSFSGGTSAETNTELVNKAWTFLTIDNGEVEWNSIKELQEGTL